MTIGLQPQPRPTAGSRRSAGTLSSGSSSPSHANDHVLTFLQLATHDLGRRAVADAEHELERLRLSIRSLHPHATGHGAAAAAAAGGGRLRVVAGALLVGEDLADLEARRLAILLHARLALLLRQTLERHELAPGLLENRVELALLCLVELVGRHQALADGLETAAAAATAAAPGRSATATTAARALTTAAAAGTAGPGRRPGVGPRGTESKRGVRHLQHVRLLGEDQLHV